MKGRPNFRNRTVWTGDNLNILRGINSQSVDLIYLDPPFNSNRNYAAPIGSEAAGAAFKDTWTLDDVDQAWHGEIADRDPALYAIIDAAGLAHGKGMKSYLIMMAVRLLEMRRVLKPTGSIYLHCDPTASHYLKALMDVIFGHRQFRDEIVWRRAAGRAKGAQHKARTLGRDCDYILHYSKTDRYVHEPPFIPLTGDELKERFPHEDNKGRRYHTRVPIFCAPSMGDRPNLCYTYNGVTNPHPSGWRVNRERLAAMDANGEIIWRQGKRPLRKSFAHNYQGKPVGSLWLDTPNVTGRERTGYPTQKPLKLLERIIKASSNEGDMVLDPFCGCATALVAAETSGRRWAGIDLSPVAARLVRERLRKQHGIFGQIDDRTDIPRRSDLGLLPNYRTHRHTLYGRQEGVCNGCLVHFPFRNLTVDHIVPQSKGGTDHESNLQLLCGACNSRKGTRTMEALIADLLTAGIRTRETYGSISR